MISKEVYGVAGPLRWLSPHRALTLCGLTAQLLEPLPEGDVQRADRLPLLLLVDQVLDGSAAGQSVLALLIRLGPVPVVSQTLHVLHDLHGVLPQHLLRRLLALWRGGGGDGCYGAAARTVRSVTSGSVGRGQPASPWSTGRPGKQEI